MSSAIAMIEMTSIGIGYAVEDAMLKAANVRVLVARTICSGKYIVIVGGEVDAARAALEAGLNAAPDGVIDSLLLPNIHRDVFAALGQCVQLSTSKTATQCLGVIETFSAASALEAADVAAKAADVTLFRIHIAMALGGKGLVMLAGSVADVQAATDAAAASVRRKGLLVSAVTIPGPSKELLADYL